LIILSHLKQVSNVIFDQFKKGEVALNFGDLAINLEGSFCLKNGDTALLQSLRILPPMIRLED
jgi:hypothetical protein